MPVILSVSQANATTDINGLARVVPASGGFSPPLEVDVMIMAGTNALLDEPLQLLPAPVGTNALKTASSAPIFSPVRFRWPALWTHSATK
jgi:hypothetical protein